MTIKVVSHIHPNLCKSNFLIRVKDKIFLPQYIKLQEFVAHQQIEDVKYFTVAKSVTTSHDMIGLIVNDEYCILSELKEKIIAASLHAQRYFYLAINKFYVYSDVDQVCQPANNNYDLLLVEYCCSTIQDRFTAINYTICPEDHGQFGNFMYPTTDIFFKKHD